MKAKSTKLKKVQSLYQLRVWAGTDERYLALAILAAQNLGGVAPNLGSAMRVLSLNANETSEAGVVAEVNYCRDLVKGPS